MVRREILAILKANKKEAKFPQLEKLCPPKLVRIHFTSTSTCMNFLSDTERQHSQIYMYMYTLSNSTFIKRMIIHDAKFWAIFPFDSIKYL